MKRFAIALTLALAGVIIAPAQTVDAIHVGQFPGRDVATKVQNAMASCPTNVTIPCILVIDPSLAVYSTGTMPTLCGHCQLSDWRNGTPVVGKVAYASTFGSIAAADAWGVANSVMVVLDQTVTLTGSTVVNAKWKIGAGGMIVCNSNPLQFNQPVDAGPFPFIDSTCTASSLVKFSALQGFVDARWWGVKADSGVTDNFAALSSMFASAANTSMGVYIPGGAGTIGFLSPLTIDGVNKVFGDGSDRSVLSTTYTAGCAVTAKNVLHGHWYGFAVQTTSATGTTTASAGFCPQNFRRSLIVDLRFDGFYTDMDTSTGTGSQTGWYQDNSLDLWISNFWGYGIFAHPPTGGTDSSDQFANTRFDNSVCKLLGTPCAPLSALDLATATDVMFSGTNFQDMTVSAPMVRGSSDATSISFTGVTHIEKITPSCTSGTLCAFFSTRGTGSNATWTFDTLRFNANSFVSTNILNGKFVIVSSQTGENYFDIRAIESIGNTSSGTTVAIANFPESGSKAPGRVRLGRLANTDGILTNAAWGNFVNSAFGSYFLTRSGGDSSVSTLAAGTVTVTTAQACTVGVDCYYRIANCGSGGTVGALSLGTVTAGTSFVINSTSNTDTSKVCWWIDRTN